jgi:aspartate racemase
VKRLGIVGGLGPLASALFYEQLTRLTKASLDQQHIELVLCSAPSIADRSAFLSGESGESPLAGLLAVCHILEKLTDLIAIPCVTAHHFYDELAGALSVPLLDMQRICAAAVGPGVTLGLMATSGALKSGRLQAVLRENGIEPVLPQSQETVMRLIYDVKAGKPPDTEAFRAAAAALADSGAEQILLACTELSLYMGTPHTPPLRDASEILARHCIKSVGGTAVDQCSGIPG